jgi:hypothetical protein
MSIDLGLINAMSSLQSIVSNYTDDNAVSIGSNSGKTNQGNYSVAIGTYAGYNNQSDSCIAIGSSSGYDSQSIRAISIGLNSGRVSQGDDSIAIGGSSGETSQGQNAIAIGSLAGNSNQSSNTVAIGHWCGQITQGSYGVAIGTESGYNSQGVYAVALGNGAGRTNQGTNAIAIGKNAGYSNQANNSIILNATGNALNGTTQGLFIKPIASSTNTTNVLVYDTATSEINYSTAGGKTFVINHPIDENKYLVHACLEGPEAGIYYRGKGTITNDESVQINLPDYVKYIGSNYTINITRIYSGKKTNETYETSEIENNSFTVYGKNGSFYWIVYAERLKMEVEPNRKDVELKGDGPYTYLMK